MWTTFSACVNWTCEGLKRVLPWLYFSISFSVNWTCEGLKHGRKAQWVSVSDGVNWTCEGLKRIYTFPLPPTPYCVNWTCEGLKRFLPRGAKRERKSVNWTCEGLKPKLTQQIIYIIHSCELNLWGIETKKSASFRLNLLSVWIEPVRDWNRIDKIAPDLAKSVNWTCEGLKR